MKCVTYSDSVRTRSNSRIQAALLTSALSLGAMKSAYAQTTPAAEITPVSSSPTAVVPTAATTANQATLPTTAATTPVEATSSSDAEQAQRIRAVRSACRAARSLDILGVVTTPALAIAGISLSVVGFTTPPAQRMVDTFFINSFGPGLVLGAIGVPLGRGMISAGDPMRTACTNILEHQQVQEGDLLAIEGLLRAYGASVSPLLMILLGAVTVATAGGVAGAFVSQNRDIAQAMGGIAAAVVAGWAIVPPTPAQRATVRYYRGEFLPSQVAPLIALLPQPNNSSVLLLGASGTF